MSSSSSIQAGGAFVAIGAITTGLEKGLKEAEHKLKSFGANIAKIGASLTGLGAAVKAPLLAAANQFAEAGAALSLASARLGIDTEPLSALQYAAQKAGVSAEGLTGSLGKMQKYLSQAEHGSSQAAGTLRELGLTAGDLKGLSQEAQLEKLADGISRIGDPGERAAMAMKVFGRAGAEMIPMLNSGSAGIEQLMNRARALGLTMDGEAAKKGLSLKNAMTDLTDVFSKMSEVLGEAVAPIVQRQAEIFTNVMVKVNSFIKTHQEMIATAFKVAGALVGVGTALAAVGGAVMVLAPAVGLIGTIASAVAAPLAIVVATATAIGTAFAYSIGVGDTFGSRLASGMGKIAGVLDEMGGSWQGFTTGMLTIWHQVVGKMQEAWITLKGWLIGIWDELKTTFPNVVYGWGGAVAKFAEGAWGAMKTAALAVKDIWESVIDFVSNKMAEHMVRANAQAQVMKQFDGKTLTRSDTNDLAGPELRKKLAEITKAVDDELLAKGMTRESANFAAAEAAEVQKRYQPVAKGIEDQSFKDYGGRQLTDAELHDQVEKVVADGLRNLEESRKAANDARATELKEKLAAIDKQAKDQQDATDKWMKEGLAMTPEEHARQTAADQAEIARQKKKAIDDSAAALAADLAALKSMPKLSDRINGIVKGVQDFFGKGPNLPAVPDFKGNNDSGNTGVADKLGAIGTFSAATAGRMFGGDNQVAANTKQANDHLKDIKAGIKQLVDNGGSAFA